MKDEEIKGNIDDVDIRIIKEPIFRGVVGEIAKEFYGNMVKGVVDVEREILALGGEWHADANTVLIENGSEQKNVWGFNFFLDRSDGKEIEYVSLINIRPAQNNRKIEIQDFELRDKMGKIIRKFIT